MTRNIDVLRAWLSIVVLVAAICATAVPIIYAFSSWRSRPLGRLFMLQAVSFASAIDITVLFLVWRPPDILVEFWIDAIVFTAIAVSTASLAVLIWRMNLSKKKGRKSHAAE